MPVESQENKRMHLQLIQNVIDRMASNSFLIKGWSLAAFGGLFTLYIANQNKEWSYDLLWLVLVCAIAFWWHDTYYLKLERQYRALYDDVTKKCEDEIDFSMKPPESAEKALCVAIRPVLLCSYGIICIASLIFLYILK
ncbi:hypothetical protein HCJ13_15505 [Listeria booriae]|uniref:hypothetical protein n=1 Tax=Listeria booriae TaxID=1552123 RepID=UPI0016273FB3|nr:hypothetical protein [Listeria booriae]MBC1651598.1 hypothetical protein [Listeria booriae]